MVYDMLTYMHKDQRYKEKRTTEREIDADTHSLTLRIDYYDMRIVAAL